MGAEESGAKQSQAALQSTPGIGGLEQMYGSRISAHSMPSCCVRVPELRSAREVKLPMELKEQGASNHPRGVRILQSSLLPSQEEPSVGLSSG